jgi:hypothetical protein
MKRAWKQRTCVLHPHPVFFRILGGGATFCLAGRRSPLIFLNNEEYEERIASLAVVVGRESDLLNFILYSQKLTSFGRCYLFTSQCSYYSVFFLIQYLFCFVLRNYKFMTMLFWLIYLGINGNMTVSCDHYCVIENILQTPFSSLSFDAKLKIIEEEQTQSKFTFWYKNLHTAF